jgi:hypothetical protein
VRWVLREKAERGHDGKDEDPCRRPNMFCKRPRPRLKPAWHHLATQLQVVSAIYLTLSLTSVRPQGFECTYRLALSMASTFQGPIGGHYVIPGTYTAAGGTTNFNIGYLVAQGRGFMLYRH